MFNKFVSSHTFKGVVTVIAPIVDGLLKDWGELEKYLWGEFNYNEEDYNYSEESKSYFKWLINPNKKWLIN